MLKSQSRKTSRTYYLSSVNNFAWITRPRGTSGQVVGLVNAPEDFTEHPQVINGAANYLRKSGSGKWMVCVYCGVSGLPAVFRRTGILKLCG